MMNAESARSRTLDVRQQNKAARLRDIEDNYSNILHFIDGVVTEACNKGEGTATIEIGTFPTGTPVDGIAEYLIERLGFRVAVKSGGSSDGLEIRWTE